MTEHPGHITHVVRSDAFAGVERYVCDTSTELARRGWKVAVIGGDATRMRAALPDTVTYARAATVGDAARAIWATGPHQIVHTHMTAAEAAAAPLKGLRFGRWVTTRHFAQPRGTSLLGRAVDPVIRRRLDTQISISQFVAESIGEPSHVIYNGVPNSTQPPQKRERTVVMMQRLQAEKDTATGLRAWALSKLAEDDWRLRIYGRGDQQGALQELATQLGVAGSVTFEGFHDEPRRVLATAGIVLASAPAEPFGLSVVEAMAEGAPVVAADGGAHRETLGQGVPLFAPGDAHAAAAAVRQLAHDPTERSALGQRLRQRHAQLFTVAAHVTQLEAVYTQ